MKTQQIYRKNLPVLHRNGITANDAAAPSTNANGIDCSGMKYALIDIVFAGTTTSWNVTPLFWNPVAGKYIAGAATTVTASGQYKVEVNGTPGLYMMVNGQVGATPNITVYVTPIND